MLSGCRLDLLFQRNQFGIDRTHIYFFFPNGRADIARDIQVEIMARDLFHGNAAGVTRLLLAKLIGGDDLLNMLIQETILALAFLEVLGRVDEQHVIRLLTLLEHQDAHRYACGIEQVGRQADHRVDVPVLEQFGADARFHATTEQHTMLPFGIASRR